jgi:hypothetical protein
MRYERRFGLASPFLPEEIPFDQDFEKINPHRKENECLQFRVIPLDFPSLHRKRA